MPIKRYALTIGSRVYSGIGNQPWTVASFDPDGYVNMIRAGRKKCIQVRSMLYTYTLVGSEADKVRREEAKRHGWKIWEQGKSNDDLQNN